MDSWYVESCRTWDQVLRSTASRRKDAAFVKCREVELTYTSFDERVSAIAGGLLALGVERGTVVALWMTNSIEWIACQCAIYRIGAILLPLHSYYRKTEIEYSLRQAEVHTLVMFGRFLDKIDGAAILDEVVPELADAGGAPLVSERFPRLRNVIVADGTTVPGTVTLDDVARRGAGTATAVLERLVDASPFDVMNIMFTSGTTGFPKGGMSMHITNLATITLWSRAAALTPDDVILCHVPLFTNFGCLYAAGLAIRNGCRLVVTEQFDAAESLRLIEQERVTYVPGTPSIFRMLLDHPDLARRDRSSLRSGHVAGAPLPEDTMREIVDVLPIPGIMQAWGLSECGGISTMSHAGHPIDKRCRTVGKPVPSSNVRIVDPDTFETRAAGEAGEIVLGDVHPGSCVGKGYFRMPEKTAAAITQDGWFRTGDIGHFDGDGFLIVSGRVDDMFTVGGFNVYPAEIENTLAKLPGVSEAYVVGVPDRRLGSVPAAWIAKGGEAAPSDDEVVRYCKSVMASQKVPRVVFRYEPGELPMTAVGKVKKKELQAMTLARLEGRETR